MPNQYDNSSQKVDIGDPSKINQYDLGDDERQNYNDILEQSIKNLQDRYNQPNWAKIAAGFAKPQLGGFLASLGSAADAYGDTIEQQRAAQLPIAEMKARLAQSKIAMDQNKSASDLVQKRRDSGMPIDPEFVSGVVARAPDSPVAKSLQAQLSTQQAQQTITASVQSNAINAIKLAQETGRTIPDSLYVQAGMTPPLPQSLTESKTRDETTNNPDLSYGAIGKKSPISQSSITVKPTDSATNQYGEDMLDKIAAGMGMANFQKWMAQGSKQEEIQNYLTDKNSSNSKNENQSKKIIPWSDPNYPISPPKQYANLTPQKQIEINNKNTKDSQDFSNQLAADSSDPNSITRRQNLLGIATSLQNPDVRNWLARASPSSIGNMVREAAQSQSSPAFISSALRSTQKILPTDSPEMVDAVQRYVGQLAQELVSVNNSTARPTDAKFKTESYSAITPEMQPKAAFQKTLEELSKMQKNSGMPFVMDPYIKQGYSLSDILQSDRVNEYNKSWLNMHKNLSEAAKNFVIPKNFTDENAWSPGFDYRSLKESK